MEPHLFVGLSVHVRIAQVAVIVAQAVAPWHRVRLRVLVQEGWRVPLLVPGARRAVAGARCAAAPALGGQLPGARTLGHPLAGGACWGTKRQQAGVGHSAEPWGASIPCSQRQAGCYQRGPAHRRLCGCVLLTCRQAASGGTQLLLRWAPPSARTRDALALRPLLLLLHLLPRLALAAHAVVHALLLLLLWLEGARRPGALQAPGRALLLLLLLLLAPRPPCRAVGLLGLREAAAEFGRLALLLLPAHGVAAAARMPGAHGGGNRAEQGAGVARAGAQAGHPPVPDRVAHGAEGAPVKRCGTQGRVSAAERAGQCAAAARPAQALSGGAAW